MSTEIDEKINFVNQLNGFKNNRVLDYQSSFHQQSIPIPGKPKKPILVRFQSVPKRDKSYMGFIKTIHAICHIEFNAINLALDAVYRFKYMPDKFYQDWISHL